MHVIDSLKYSFKPLINLSSYTNIPYFITRENRCTELQLSSIALRFIPVLRQNHSSFFLYLFGNIISMENRLLWCRSRLLFVTGIAECSMGVLSLSLVPFLYGRSHPYLLWTIADNSQVGAHAVFCPSWEPDKLWWMRARGSSPFKRRKPTSVRHHHPFAFVLLLILYVASPDLATDI